MIQYVTFVLGANVRFINMYIQCIYMNAEKTLTKTVKRYGNSGGVYLPSSWVGGEVEVNLIHKPPKPEIDLLIAFAENMKHIISILIYGSYARNEQTDESDIDVIVVTDKHEKSMKVPPRLKGMNYDIRIMDRDFLNKVMNKDALFSKAIEGSVAIFNDSFLDELKLHKINKNVKEHVELARSSFGIMKDIFEMGGRRSDLVYPVIMRIKEMLLIKCILDGREFTMRLVEDTLKDMLTESEVREVISSYRSARDGKVSKKREFDDGVFTKLFEILGGLIDYAEKKEKA